MELFSKRNEGQRLRRLGSRQFPRQEDETNFLKVSLRNRLREQIKYVIRSKVFLESFLYVNNKQTGETYLHSASLSDLSMREAGYDIASAFDLASLEPNEESRFEDAKFFDLLELFIIFTLPVKRIELVGRLSDVFNEEGNDFAIHGSMIVSREQDGLRSIVPLLKEKNLRDKVGEYYQQRMAISQNYEFLARISADILQLLFSSSEAQSKTKKHSTDLCEQVAFKWTEKGKSTELAELFSNTVKNAKQLSNQIQNVRHTDRTTIPIESPNFYKLIALKNISIIELVILSLPELFISSQDPETIKESYLKRYDLNKDTQWAVKAREIPQDFFGEIDPSSIPF
jgi:hypothetical protein